MLLAAREPEGMREGERGAGLPRWSACTFGGAPAPRFASFAPGEAKSRRPAPHSAAASSVPMLPSAFGKRAGEADCVICASRRTRLRPSPFGRLRKRPQRGGMGQVYAKGRGRGQVFLVSVGDAEVARVPEAARGALAEAGVGPDLHRDDVCGEASAGHNANVIPSQDATHASLHVLDMSMAGGLCEGEHEGDGEGPAALVQ
jgi:hypothetical protein